MLYHRLRSIRHISHGYKYLSKDSRLRLTIIACKTRLNRTVSLEDRIWAYKLVENSDHARGIWERMT
jgi:hypothetical protein